MTTPRPRSERSEGQHEAIGHDLTFECSSAHLKAAQHRAAAVEQHFALEQTVWNREMAHEVAGALGPIDVANHTRRRLPRQHEIEQLLDQSAVVRTAGRGLDRDRQPARVHQHHDLHALSGLRAPDAVAVAVSLESYRELHNRTKTDGEDATFLEKLIGDIFDNPAKRLYVKSPRGKTADGGLVQLANKLVDKLPGAD